ncbi:probable G-protein coupled receptor 139 [Mobula birostris]|uniref:probable G-protein coupled receptor 139 n=1 Tax=Mobula birostris TaxID=1983395 RepID=UPI003B28206A
MLDERTICYTVIIIVGIPVNLVAIIILSRGKCGLSKCVTRYLVAMAAADLMVVMIEVLFYRMGEAYRLYRVLDNAPFCLVHYVMCHVAVDCSVWVTVAFTFDRFVAICSAKFKTKYYIPKIAVNLVAIVILSRGKCDLSKCITRYLLGMATADLLVVISDPLLKWTVYIYFWSSFLYWTPVFRRIVSASKVRMGLRGRSNGKKDKDPEMENRRKSVVLLFSITGSFIFLWLTRLVFDIYVEIANISRYTDTDPIYIADSTATMPQILSSCSNTCIYAVTQSKFRQQLKNAVIYPLKLLPKCIKS